MSYDVLSQTAAEVAELGTAPAVAIGPYMLKTGQTFLRVISIYAKRSDSQEQLRLFYMNAPALALGGNQPTPARVLDSTEKQVLCL